MEMDLVTARTGVTQQLVVYQDNLGREGIGSSVHSDLVLTVAVEVNRR
jgi:hypothetical protein